MQQNVDELRQSRSIKLDLNGVHYEVGEIDPIVESEGFRDGEVLSGNHREAARWKSRRKIPIKDDLDWALKHMAVVAQRIATETEQVELVTELCEALVRHDH